MVKVVIGTKVCSFEELIEEYGRVCKENEELRKQISELESKNKEANDKIHKLEVELAEKDAWFKIRGGLNADPLPFSDEQYEEKIDKIEKAVLGIQAYLKKGTEQKIKELEEEQEKLRLEADYYRFWQETISPLKPTSEVHRMKGL